MKQRASAGMVGALICFAAVLQVVAVGPARAGVAKLEVGVWSRQQPDGGTAPFPPTVPTGGLWVASDAGGPSAVSALRVPLADAESNPVVTLKVSKLTAAPSNAATGTLSGTPMLACPTTTVWAATDPAAPGQWSARPTYDCAKGQVVGALSADGSSVTFDLATLSAPGVDVVVAIVPGQVANPAGAAPAGTPAIPPAPAGSPVAPADPTSATVPAVFDATFMHPDTTAIGVNIAPTPPPPAADVSPYVAPADTTATLPALVTAPPTTAASPGAIAPAGPALPVVAIPRRIARQAVAIAKINRTQQLVLGLVLIALSAWAWEAMQGSGGLLAGKGPLFSLYDTPPSTMVSRGPAMRLHSDRAGKPPSLR